MRIIHLVVMYVIIVIAACLCITITMLLIHLTLSTIDFIGDKIDNYFDKENNHVTNYTQV